MKNINTKLITIFIFIFVATNIIFAQKNYDSLFLKIAEEGLDKINTHRLLSELCTTIGNRVTGSESASKAVEWTKSQMEKEGADFVWTEKMMVPHWVRGKIEKAEMNVNGKKIKLDICALGGSIATPKNGIEAEVIEVKNFDEVRALGEKAKGKIIFYNRPFDRKRLDGAYGNAVNQRSIGAIEAAKVSAIGSVIRSMTYALDDKPHTGAMHYEDSVTKIPHGALSTISANLLSETLKKEKNVKLKFILSSETLPDVESANVIGEIRGSEFPNEIIVVGGHLDSWDKGQGAHDDGSGCMQSIEVLSLIKRLGLKPKRTIRAVMFMNEENGLRGGLDYASNKNRANEKHIAAIESDAGGFMPHGFGVTTDSIKFEKLKSFAKYLEFIGCEKFQKGGGGADISPLQKQGVPVLGLNPDGERYFDYHHSDNDTIDKVNSRELEFGAIAMTILSFLISEEGL